MSYRLGAGLARVAGFARLAGVAARVGPWPRFGAGLARLGAVLAGVLATPVRRGPAFGATLRRGAGPPVAGWP